MLTTEVKTKGKEVTIAVVNPAGEEVAEFSLQGFDLWIKTLISELAKANAIESVVKGEVD